MLLISPFPLTNTSRAPDAIQVKPCAGVEQVDIIPEDYDTYQAEINRLKIQVTLDLLRSDNDQDQESVGIYHTLLAIALEMAATYEKVSIVSSVEKNEKRAGKLSEQANITKKKKIHA